MLKELKRRNGARILSSCRRVEAVRPLRGKPRVALVFPGAPCTPETGAQLEALASADAKATFGVFGSTKGQYPDRKGFGRYADGIRFAHYPDWQKDEEGGIVHQPSLLAEILAAGHTAAGLGFSPRPLRRGTPLVCRKPWKGDSAAYADYDLLQNTFQEETGTALSFFMPVGNAEITKEESSVFDLFSALNGQLLTCAFDFSLETNKTACAQFEKLLLKKPAKLNGRTVALPPLFPAEELAKILTRIDQRGFEAVSLHTLTSDSPFLDATADAFADAAALHQAGFTLTTRENAILPEHTLSRIELYGMMVPPEIRQDYQTSRFLRQEASFPVNRRSEKEYFLSPGRVTTAGMFYAFEAGWPLSGKHSALTPADFAAFLDVAAEGKTVNWAIPDRKQLYRRDVWPALKQLLLD